MSTKIAELAVGDRHEADVVEDLSRTQIVMYAGASGDFNPLHTDEVYATQVAGYPTVLAHGGLTVGLTAKLITDWLADAEMTRFGVRFHQQVWPGATLTARATVTSVSVADGRAVVDIDLETVDEQGRRVLSGYAQVRDLA
jgi:acyl dehydratase